MANGGHFEKWKIGHRTISNYVKLKFPTFENPRWRTAAILKKGKNRNISAALWAISPNFGMQTQFNPLERPNRKKIQNFQNPRWRRPPSWKIENRPYLLNGLTNLREIWYGDAYWASKWDRKLKFPTFENPRWRTVAILKRWKIAISQLRFEQFRQKSARRRIRPSWASQPLIIWNFQNPRWRRPPSWKIAVSYTHLTLPTIYSV